MRWLVVLVCASLAVGATFEATVVDGFGRPLAGAKVMRRCFGDRMTETVFVSDASGSVRGEVSDCAAGRLFIGLEKEGYARDFGDPGDGRLVLRRGYDAGEIHRIAMLPEDAKRPQLRELLAGTTGAYTDASLIAEDERLRPALRELAIDSDYYIANRARSWLARIGDEEDVQLLAKIMVRFSYYPEAFDAVYDMLKAMVDPATEDEWILLKNCALGQCESRSRETAAVQSLTLNGSPRSLEILREAGKPIGKPAPLVDENLKRLVEEIGRVIAIGDRLTIEPPTFNEAGDRAIVAFHSFTDDERFGYAATCQRIKGRWHLRGVRADGFAIGDFRQRQRKNP